MYQFSIQISIFTVAMPISNMSIPTYQWLCQSPHKENEGLYSYNYNTFCMVNFYNFEHTPILCDITCVIPCSTCKSMRTSR